MKTIYCDECKKEFVIDIKTEELEDNVIRTYIKCPHCSKEYTSYYTDVLIRVKQNKIRAILEKHKGNTGTGNVKKAKSISKQYEKLKKEISKDMDNLKNKTEGN